MSPLSSSDGPYSAEEILPLVYEELRNLAAARIAGEHAPQTLQATALVHEAYLKLLGPEEAEASGWSNRAHFFGAASEAMRRILIDRARARGAQKRGGGYRRLQLDACLALDTTPREVLDLDDALSRLLDANPQRGELVKLRFFGGLTVEQAAAVLGISRATAERAWTYARAWLFSELNKGESQSDSS
ncbi:MAG: ECF-type sigma factor [Planctomycetota bacterium]